ncbi:hypothetical protein B0T16DRAFT_454461 [Cercophora newfieldiana]|uniref:DUF6594 domain-containing protein n=1 Tax=Cercophora newfieldiana TaxID=92897 RepID=A0AA39YGE3_9PEZI|nr:hypothetical protein B0T16DRAFT_454461 [Cercophora newfieldiana]
MPEQPVEISVPAPTPLPQPPRAARPNRRWTWSNGSSECPNFIPGNNFDGYPVGRPLLAKEQSFYVNGSLHRRFAWVRQICLEYKAAKIHQLQEKLMALYKEEEANNPASLRSLTPWQRGVEGGEDELSSQEDKLIQEIDALVGSYDRTFDQDRRMRKAPERRVEASNLLRHIDHANMLDDEARRHYLELDDFATTRDQSDAIPELFDSLIYGSKGSFTDILMKPFVNKEKTENSTWGTHYLHKPMKQTFTALSASAVLLMLLAPIGILYFVEPSKPISFSVVLIFATAAAWMMSKLPGAKFETVFIAGAAYMAVQVTFLANFQGSSK